MNEFCLSILNGCILGDKKGEFTFVYKNGSSCIDLCLTNNSFSGDDIQFNVLDNEGSCHFPVLFSINPSKCSPVIFKREKVIWKPDKTTQFCETLEASLTNHTIETITFNSLSHHIIQSLQTCEMLITVESSSEISRGPVWFDDKCKKYKTIMRKALRKFRKSYTTNDHFHEIRAEYFQSKRAYCNLLLAKKKKHYCNLELRLSNLKYPGDFFKALSHYRLKYQNSFISNPIEPTVFADYFSRQFNLYEASGLENASRHIVDRELDCDFCLDELEEAIRKLSSGKAPGSDCIPNEVWKS
jgi:hypothetical protein